MMSEDSLHIPGEIGTHDSEGWRTFQIPGDVCLGCSNPRTGLWVPVNMCPIALTKYTLDEAES